MAASVSASCLIGLSSLAVVLVALASAASAQLSSTFYDRSCPNALSTIRSGVNSAVRQEPRVGASLLRLHFHDCFVRASEVSIILYSAFFLENTSMIHEPAKLSLKNPNPKYFCRAATRPFC